MTVPARIRAGIVSAMLSRWTRSMLRQRAELKRIVRGEPHRVIFFFRIDDPWSVLLARELEYLQEAFDISLQVRILAGLPAAAFMPQPDLLDDYARIDAARLAAVMRLDWHDAPLRESADALSAWLASSQEETDALARCIDAGTAYWAGDRSRIDRILSGDRADAMRDAQGILDENAELLTRLGHYQSAMLFYGDEWYWGVDRLWHLVRRLEERGLARRQGDEAMRQLVGHLERLEPDLSPLRRTEDLSPLEMFFSFRSPYSYIALERTYRLADAFDLDLRMRPVLPMVMRGLPVPKEKRLYIVKDAKREADRYGIPFGRIVDPVGAGAERCLALAQWAATAGREREYFLSVARGIWAEGVDVATDEGLAGLVQRAGLDFEEGRAWLARDDWREQVERNRETMFSLGVWGVPAFRHGEFVTWGQDRLGLLARHVRELSREEIGR